MLTIEDVMDKTEHTGPGATEGSHVPDKNPSEQKSTETPSIEVSISCPAEGCLEGFPPVASPTGALEDDTRGPRSHFTVPISHVPLPACKAGTGCATPVQGPLATV